MSKEELADDDVHIPIQKGTQLERGQYLIGKLN
jgi:hypothetical protein